MTPGVQFEPRTERRATSAGPRRRSGRPVVAATIDLRARVGLDLGGARLVEFVAATAISWSSRRCGDDRRDHR